MEESLGCLLILQLKELQKLRLVMEQRETNPVRGGLDVWRALKMISTLEFWIGGDSGKRTNNGGFMSKLF